MRNICTNSNLKNIYIIKKEKVNNCYDLISALYREIKPNVVNKVNFSAWATAHTTQSSERYLSWPFY